MRACGEELNEWVTALVGGFGRAERAQGYWIREKFGISIGCLAACCRKHDRALAEFADEGVDVVVSELLPDELSFPVSESNYIYFERRFVFLPPILGAPPDSGTGADWNRSLVVYDSSEVAGGGYSVSALRPLLEGQGRVLFLDVASEDLDWGSFGEVSTCRYELGQLSRNSVLRVHLMCDRLGIECRPWGEGGFGFYVSPVRFAAFGLRFPSGAWGDSSIKLIKLLSFVFDKRNVRGKGGDIECVVYPEVSDVVSQVMAHLSTKLERVGQNGCFGDSSVSKELRFIVDCYKKRSASLGWFVGDVLPDWSSLKQTQCRFLKHFSQLNVCHQLFAMEEADGLSERRKASIESICEYVRGDFVLLVSELEGAVPFNRTFHFCMKQYPWWVDACVCRVEKLYEKDKDFSNGFGVLALNILDGFEIFVDEERREENLILCSELIERDRALGRQTSDVVRAKVLEQYYKHGLGAEFEESIDEIARDEGGLGGLFVHAAFQCSAVGDYEGARECFLLEEERGALTAESTADAAHCYARSYDFEGIDRLDAKYKPDLRREMLVVDGLCARVWQDVLASSERTVDALAVEAGLRLLGRMERGESPPPVLPFRKTFFLLALGENEAALGDIRSVGERPAGMCTRLASFAWVKGELSLALSFLDLEPSSDELIPSDLVRYACLQVLLSRSSLAVEALRLLDFKYPCVFSSASRDVMQWLFLGLACRSLGLVEREQECLSIFRRFDRLGVSEVVFLDLIVAVEDRDCRSAVNELRFYT